MTDGGEVIASVTSDGPDCQLSQDGWDDRVDLVEDWIVATTSMWDAPPTFVTGSGSGSSTGSATGSGGGSDDGSGGDGTTMKSGGCSSTGSSGAWIALVLLPFAWRRRLSA